MNQIEYSEIDDVYNKETRSGKIDGKYTAISDLESLQNSWNGIGRITNAFQGEDGGYIVMVHSEEYDPVSEEDRLAEIEIQKYQDQMRNLACKMRNHEGNPKDGIEEYNSMLNGYGIDAALRTAHTNLILYGAREILDVNNPYAWETFNSLLDAISPENAEQTGYLEDSYTMITKLGIYSRILNDPQIDQNSQRMQQLKEKMIKADPEIYALLERETQIVEKIQTITEKQDLIEAGLDLLGTIGALSREEFLEKIEAIREQLPNVQVDTKYTDKFRDYEAEYKLEEDYRERERQGSENRARRRAELIARSSEPEVFERKKNTAMHLMEKSRVGVAVSTFFSSTAIENDNGQNIEIMSQLLDFDKVGEEGNFVDKITSQDIEMMKRKLKELLRDQDDQKTPYICALGDIISKSTEREKGKVISAENIDVKDVIENMSADRIGIFEANKADESELSER